jgi:tetratricopeptide (TPR) repeat protein
MKQLFLYFFCIVTSISCTNKIDKSNPDLVIRNYLELLQKQDYKNAYKYLSDSSKKLFSYLDYLNYKTDSTRDTFLLVKGSLKQLPSKTDLPNIKGYGYLYFKKNDSLNVQRNYLSVIKDSIGWGIIWTYPIFLEASKYGEKLEFDKAIQKYRSLLRIDPFNIGSMKELSWCFLRENFPQYDEAEKYAKQALDLTQSAELYNTLASIYSNKNYHDLAIQIYFKAITSAEQKEDIKYTYGNIALEYMELKDFKNADSIINIGLRGDSTYTHFYFVKGGVKMSINELDSAIYYFRKGVKLEPLDNYLQKGMYYEFSDCLFKKATLNSKKMDSKSFLIEAKDYVLKALEIDPDDKDSQELLKKIKERL